MKRKLKYTILVAANLYGSWALAQAPTGAAPAKDPLSESQAELEKEAPSVQEQLLQTLQEMNTTEMAQFNQISAFNTTMCQKLDQVNQQCPAQAYLMAPVGAPDLGCTANSAAPTAPAFSVVATGLQGLHFRIKANKDYISDEFSEGGGPITFHRDDNQPVLAPRFREVTSLSLVAVAPGSIIDNLGNIKSTTTIDPAKQAALLSQMKFQIMINGAPLGGATSTSMKIIASDANADSSVQPSSVQVDPAAIYAASRNPTCMISPQEIDQMQKSSEAAGNASGNSK